jgi:cellulose synthase/poly-beta-1,6-N-acetylglucosamine synthase-like glycosyltransferase
VRFVSEAHVGVTAPSSLAALDIQRTRWARGNLSLGRRHALGCLLRGLLTGSWQEADLGGTLLLLSRPLWLAHLAMVLLAAMALVRSGAAPAWLPTAAILLVAFYGAYLLLGILRVGLTARRLLLLSAAPLLVARLAWIALRVLPASAASTWTRTPR